MSGKKKKGKVVIEWEMCKSCGFCVEHCPKGTLAISEKHNSKGYYPAEQVNEDCNGCAICATMCPEGIIEVFRE